MKIINKTKVREWVAKVGGTTKAARILESRTRTSFSLCKKVARGSYASEPSYLFRKVLCELSGFSEAELFVENGIAS